MWLGLLPRRMVWESEDMRHSGLRVEMRPLNFEAISAGTV